MDDITKKQIKRRIASAAGHLKGIERMVDEDTYCIDVIRQVQAVQAALNKANTLILEQHLQGCVANAVRGDDAAEREQMLTEITALFETSTKI